MTPAQKRTLMEIQRRSKGWPVGIPAQKAMACRLVALGYAEWAPPAYLYRKPMFTIRLTVRGEVALEQSR